MSDTSTGTIAAYIVIKKDPAQDIRDHYEASKRQNQKRRERWLEIYRNVHGYNKLVAENPRQANFFYHKLLPQAEREAARFMTAYFSHTPFVSIMPNRGATVESARQMEQTLQYYYEHCPVFYLSRLRQIKYAIYYGCGFVVPSWRTVKRKVKTVVPFQIWGQDIPGIKDIVEREETVYDGLWFDVYPPHEVFPYPGVIQHHDMPAFVVREFIQAEKLVELAKSGLGGYDLSKVVQVPTNCWGQDEDDYWAKARAIGHPSPDKDPGLICLLHKFERNRWRTLANNAVVVRDIDAPECCGGEIPVLQSVKTVDPDSYYPIGSLAPLLVDQKLFNVFVNSAANSTLQNVWPIWKHKANIDPNRLLSFPNNRIQVRSMDDVDIIKMPELKADVQLLIGFLAGHIEEVSGYQGPQKGYSDQRHTATSDSIFQQEGDKRITYDTMTQEYMGLLPEARQSARLVQYNMPPEMEMRLGGPAGSYFQRMQKEGIRGDFDFRVSGSTEAIGRDLVQQQLINFFNVANQAVQWVRAPNGAMFTAPILNARETIKDIFEGWGKRNSDQLMYQPYLFGDPVDNQALDPAMAGAQGAMPGMQHLIPDPRTGALISPNKLPRSLSPAAMRSRNQTRLAGVV